MYRVLLDGVSIECDSMEEAKRLARSIANEERADAHAKPRASASQRGSGFDARAAKLLRLVREAGSNGLPGAKLAAALGLETPKGLGPITAAMNRRLKAKKLEPSSVYEGKRIGKERGWFAKEKIDEALTLLAA